MPNVIQLLCIHDYADKTWWTRTVSMDGLPDKGDRACLWGTRETWLAAPVAEAERRNWLADGTLAVSLALDATVVAELGGEDVFYGKLREADWEKVETDA